MNDRSVYPLGKRRTLIVLAGTLLGMLLASINQTLAATALPMIVGELGGLAQYSWVFSAYVLGATLTIPLYGKLSDIYGRRALFTAAIGALFVQVHAPAAAGCEDNFLPVGRPNGARVTSGIKG